MREVNRKQQADGYEQIEATPYEMLGGVAFARRDFKKGIVYESVLVKACDAQALVLIFAGADEETVDNMRGATKLRLDPTSGCISNAAMPQDSPPSPLPSTTEPNPHGR